MSVVPFSTPFGLSIASDITVTSQGWLYLELVYAVETIIWIGSDNLFRKVALLLA